MASVVVLRGVVSLAVESAAPGAFAANGRPARPR